MPILNGNRIKQRSHQTYDQTHVLLLSMVPKWLTSVIQQHRLEKWSTVASLTVLWRWKRFIIGGSHALEVLSQHSGNIGSRRLLYSPQVVQLEEWIKLQPFSIEGRRWCKEATMKKGWRSAKN
jgi:hypothetical protein